MVARAGADPSAHNSLPSTVGSALGRRFCLGISLLTLSFVVPTQSEVEETIKRLSSHKGVEGIVIVNMEGIPIRTTLDNDKTVQHAALITQLTAKARSVVRDLDPQNDLTFLRIRSKKHEIMVAPDKEYILIVLQNPHNTI
ncbi:Dynein light chain roadblock-type 2 [Irineochytrium annulatum]|nr:Dynein light chain roadblock-type 2 [Irineochytrium annulatum]